ncbi:MAG: response regulator [Candidatus Odinarchaeota archaeon]
MIKLLLVDDDNDFLELLIALINSAFKPRNDLLIDLANSAAEALELIKENQYDVIVSDYNLKSGKNGMDILVEAREKSSASLFMFTSDPRIRSIFDSRFNGSAFFFGKDKSLELVSQIHEMTGHPEYLRRSR